MNFLKYRPASTACLGLASALFAATFVLRLAAAPQAQAPQPGAPTPADVEFFEANIRPVLFDVCGECHVDDEEGGLKLDSRESMLTGGDTGPAIVPGDPDKSLLMHVIRRDE